MHPPSGDRPSIGLRERNRERTRAELAAAALALFVERGFDAVTVDDIAEGAGVSRRTFFRYFESKEDAVLPYEEDRLDQLRDALADRPRGEPVLLSIRHATMAIGIELSQEPLRRTESLQRMRIIEANPSVHARSLELQSRMESEICQLVADHLGVEASTSLEANVVAGASIAAIRAAAHVWLSTGGTGEFTDMVDQAYDVLDTGLSITHEG